MILSNPVECAHPLYRWTKVQLHWISALFVFYTCVVTPFSLLEPNPVYVCVCEAGGASHAQHQEILKPH